METETVASGPFSRGERRRRRQPGRALRRHVRRVSRRADPRDAVQVRRVRELRLVRRVFCARGGARSPSHWSPYDRVGVVNAVP